MGKSEFGKGLGYCLGLFLAHDGRRQDFMKMEETYKKGKSDTWCHASTWFNGVGDHFFEFLPEHMPKHLVKRAEKLKDKCLTWRCGYGGDEPTWEDAAWALQEAKDLLRLIDKHNGVPVQKGDFE